MSKLDISKLDVLSLMRFDACTRCGECTTTCPTGSEAQEDELVTPRGKIMRLRKMYFDQYGLKARLLGAKNIPKEELDEFAKRAYECTICGQCKTVCPAELDTISMWENMREFLVGNALAPLPAHDQIIKSILNYDNPWMQPRAQRAKWSKRIEKEVKIRDALKERPDLLYFVGCTASLDPNIKDMAIGTARLLSRAGLDFGTLGNEEGCCGSTLLRTGLVDDAKKTALNNIAKFEKASPGRIVTSCAGCYKTLRQDYPKLGAMNSEVVHIVQLVSELLEEGKLPLKAPGFKGTVTYHDPCHLGRHMNLYEPPRKILESIPGLRLVEMERTKAEARCCGAGGGVKTAFPELAAKISALRIEDAERTEAGVLVTSCPFCFQSLQAAIDSKKSKIQIMDLIDLVSRSSA